MRVRTKQDDLLSLDSLNKLRAIAPGASGRASALAIEHARQAGCIPLSAEDMPIDEVEKLSSAVVPASGAVSIATMIRVDSGDQRPEAGDIPVEVLPLLLVLSSTRC
jgi:hypothetical protein